MGGPRFRIPALLLAGVALARGGAAMPGGAAARQQPTFASGVAVVPIDVRAVDSKTGKAVTDLTADDFTLLEDGVVQPVRLFEMRTLAPDTAQGPATGGRLLIRRTPFEAGSQNHRVFLFVLGRGRLQEPSGGVDALIRFVRQRLLPQDRVAVFAYDRATDFTTDHESIARLLERFKRVHYGIDMDVRLQVESGLSALYGSRKLPKKVQDKIDSLFAGGGAPASRRAAGVQAPAVARLEQDAAKQAERLQLADADRVGREMAALEGDTGGGLASWTSLDEVTNEAFAGISFDDYVQYTAQMLLDLSNCYAGIEYLRHLAGEKHLVFVTERGMYLPRAEDDAALARAASDARVAISTFQTGGLIGQQGGVPQSNWNETFAFKALRTMAELTGGVSSIAESGETAMSRLDEATRVSYLLGYYPSLARMDGSYREIEVRVRRPGVTALYRRGYFAERAIGPFNRRDFITRDRIQAAAGFSREIHDIRIRLEADLVRQKGGAHQLAINASIDPSRLAFSTVAGERVGAIDILIVGADADGRVLAQHYQRAALRFNDEGWANVTKNGVPYRAHVEINPGVRQVRFIVYDYRADLVGRADRRVF
ncbi:MAG TPA: VWA domain-containing protein [Vicinamibacterales bacterium]|nr:VWA domain-containing protein [Vicinamibacterales bacterium]HPW19206.1 VWA domain-containing protein [Vicinamibacterales bacterium]